MAGRVCPTRGGGHSNSKKNNLITNSHKLSDNSPFCDIMETINNATYEENEYQKKYFHEKCVLPLFMYRTSSTEPALLLISSNNISFNLGWEHIQINWLTSLDGERSILLGNSEHFANYLIAKSMNPFFAFCNIASRIPRLYISMMITVKFIV